MRQVRNGVYMYLYSVKLKCNPMRTIFSVVLGLLFIVSGCSKENVELADYKSGKIDLSASAGTTAKVKSNRIGSMLDVLKPTTGGTCLMGGNTDVDAAFKWMISKSGGGDFVVIRFDKSTGYNSYVYNMGGCKLSGNLDDNFKGRREQHCVYR